MNASRSADQRWECESESGRASSAQAGNRLKGQNGLSFLSAAGRPQHCTNKKEKFMATR